MTNRIALKVAIFAGTMLASPAFAQVASSEPAAEEAGASQANTTVDEIVVTAQRRSERLQDVPIQVTAFNAQRIEDAGIQSTADVVAQVPNVTFDRGNNYRSSFITMRGLTQINNADPPIAFVLDGVPQTNQETIGVSLFDVERIEVLKGPQGALYGRNAVGGAINVITKRPSNVFEGFVNASYANGDSINAAAGLSGPIVADKVLFRVSASYKSRNGLVDNDFRGDEVDYIDHDVSIRGRLLLSPSEPLTIDLRAEHGDFRAGSNYYSAVLSGDPNDFVNPQMNFDGFADGRNTDFTAKIDHDLDFATLTSITSHGRFAQKIRADLDFRNPVDSPGGFFGLGFQLGQGQNQRIQTTSQEIRLVSANNQSVRWLAGGYYLHTKRSLVTRGFLDLNSDPAQFDNPALLLINKSERGKNDAYAAFAQVDVDITSSLTITGGLRYDYDRRRQTNVGDDSTRQESFDHLQPKVTATWKIDPDRLLYATYSTGFRSGGFNAPDVTVTRFDQETLENYEIGFKSQFLNRRLTLNGAAFMTDVRNYQFFYVDAATASQVIDTIDKVRIKGLELEALARLTPGLDASIALGFLDSEIRHSLFPEDVGNKAPRTVPFSATSSFQYRTQLKHNVEGFGRIEWQHYGKKYWSADNAAVQKAYNIVNLRAGVEFAQIGLYGFVSNLFEDEYYGEFFQPKYSGLDVAIGFPGSPRSFGVEARVKF